MDFFNYLRRRLWANSLDLAGRTTSESEEKRGEIIAGNSEAEFRVENTRNVLIQEILSPQIGLSKLRT